MNPDGWPLCARCLCPVHAYGIENVTDRTFDVWARCDGHRVAGATGLETIRHRPMRAVQSVTKREGWTAENARAAIGLLVFFP